MRKLTDLPRELQFCETLNLMIPAKKICKLFLGLLSLISHNLYPVFYFIILSSERIFDSLSEV